MPPTNRAYRIAVIPGDGIGKERSCRRVRALEAVAKKSASKCGRTLTT
jgi:tartrate dehydrogenase/decarboxylase/D-malate dehydrogenase